MLDTTPYWFENRKEAHHPALTRDLEVDVLVIGGGIAGVTAAYLMAKEGRTVALLERGNLGGQDTGHTTAHLTYMTDTRLSDLISTFSRQDAKLAWDAGKASMDLIESTVDQLQITCGFKRVPGYLAASLESESKEESSLLNHEAMVTRQMGFEAHYINSDPITHRPGIRFEGQMEFHPLQYVDALAARAVELGAKFFENSEVDGFHENRVVMVDSNRIRYSKVFISTHVPLQGTATTVGAALFQTKLALYTTYAVRAEMKQTALPKMIWSDTADPFLYLRIQDSEDGLSCILGGEDHRTGQEDSSTFRFEALEASLQRLIPHAEITHRWSGQVVETVDGLPFIGPISSDEYIATGFSGNGMTFGTAAAMMFRDWFNGDTHPCSELFDPSRRTASALGEYFRENKDYPARMISDRLRVPAGDPANLKAGEAKVLEHNGKKVAAYRSPQGELSLCSAICPHMACVVAWNNAEATWDCPCHGSRFKACGEVLAGPAERDLGPV